MKGWPEDTEMNWSNFFSMGGYAFYVWGSYGLALLLMGGETILVMQRQRALLERNPKSDRKKSK